MSSYDAWKLASPDDTPAAREAQRQHERDSEAAKRLDRSLVSACATPLGTVTVELVEDATVENGRGTVTLKICGLPCDGDSDQTLELADALREIGARLVGEWQERFAYRRAKELLNGDTP